MSLVVMFDESHWSVSSPIIWQNWFISSAISLERVASIETVDSKLLKDLFNIQYFFSLRLFDFINSAVSKRSSAIYRAAESLPLSSDKSITLLKSSPISNESLS